MTLEEKTQFVEDLITSVKKSILEKLPKAPGEWDGHELRQYIADCFKEQRGDLLKAGTTRFRRYVNAVAANNL
jgi:hypothetical protein